MVSVKSAAWTVILIQLVLSCVGLIATLALVSAQLQSISIYPERQQPSKAVIVTCSCSFVMIFTTVFAMFGLTLHRRFNLIPQITMSIVSWFIHFVSTVYEFYWWNMIQFDIESSIWVASTIAVQSFFLFSLYLLVRCYTHMI
uniref:Transmembrane protein n=1 Tax=Steinernema glaseri TaxID=37863 RepID=A0A1I7ZR91_9BILA